MKKFWVVTLAVAIFASILTGCGQKQAGEQINDIDVAALGDLGGLEMPLDNKNTKITWIVASSVEGLNDKYAMQALRNITGVNVQLEVYPLSTVNDKVKVLFASKNLPDIIGSGIATMTEVNDYGTQGALASVNDNLDVMPNFKKIFKDNPENDWVFKSYQAGDGKLYAFHGYDLNRDVNHGVLYRKDIFDKHGIEMWNSPEEFYQALKKLKEIYPDSYPFTSKNGDGIFEKLATSWGIDVTQAAYYNEDEKIWKSSITSPEYKNELDYLKKLYDEGLIDSEFLTLTQAQWTTRMTQENVSFVTWDWIGRLDMFKTQTANSLPDYDLRYGNPIGPKQTIVTLPKVFFPITISNGKNTKLACKLVDFFYSDAGRAFVSMGVPGETYNINDKGVADYVGYESGQKIEITELEEKYGLYIEGMYRGFDRRSSYFQFSEREQEAQDYFKQDGRMEPEDPIPLFTEEEQNEITKYQTNLMTACKEFSTNYILSDKTGDAAWNEWTAKAEGLGCGKIVEIYNAAQKRYDAQ